MSNIKFFFFFSSRRRHTRSTRDWSSDVCSSDLEFQPYIERIADGQPQVLSAQRVLQFGLTSGSTQASKLIPYTKVLVSEFQEGIDPWVYYLFRRFPRILLGKTYWSVTPIGERKSHTAGGIAIGF